MFVGAITVSISSVEVIVFVGVLTVSISVCGGDSVLVHGCDVSQVLVVLVVFPYARESCPDVDGDFKFSVYWAEDVIALSD